MDQRYPALVAILPLVALLATTIIEDHRRDYPRSLAWTPFAWAIFVLLVALVIITITRSWGRSDAIGPLFAALGICHCSELAILWWLTLGIRSGRYLAPICWTVLLLVPLIISQQRPGHLYWVWALSIWLARLAPPTLVAYYWWRKMLKTKPSPVLLTFGGIQIGLGTLSFGIGVGLHTIFWPTMIYCFPVTPLFLLRAYTPFQELQYFCTQILQKAHHYPPIREVDASGTNKTTGVIASGSGKPAEVVVSGNSLLSRPPLGSKESRMAKTKILPAPELRIETDKSERLDSGGTPIDDSSVSSITFFKNLSVTFQDLTPMLCNLLAQCSDLQKNPSDQKLFAGFVAETVSLKASLRDVGVTANQTLTYLEDKEAQVEVGKIWEMVGHTEQLIAFVEDISVDHCGSRKCYYVLELLKFCESTIKGLSTMKQTALQDWKN